MQLLLATRGGCLHNSFDLIWVNLYPLLSDHKPQKLVCAYSKGTFGRIELHVVLSQQAKDFFLKSGRNNQVKMRHCRGLPRVTIWQVTIGSTWHPSIPVRVNITKSKYLVQIRSTNGQSRGIPLKQRNAFRVSFLTHSHEQSFSLRQKHARWDATLSSQAA